MRKSYLTIDDTPSASTPLLADYLEGHRIPAIFFCRGDRLEHGVDGAAHALERGHRLANHAFSHRRASQVPLKDMMEEIDRTEALIDLAYRRAGKQRDALHFRFPHMDRGCGGWVVDFDACPDHRKRLEQLFTDGLNVDLTPPTAEMRDKKAQLQEFLRARGYTAPAFPGVIHDWYADTEMARAVDAMFTFSSSDWMLTPRHLGKWPHRSIGDLKARIDADADLARTDSAHIILMHDQDDLLPVVRALIEHMLSQGFIFYPEELS